MLHEAISKMPEAFESKMLLRGQEYFLNDRVLSIRFSEGLLRGRVKGSSSQIYDVHMDLKTWPEKASRCSCPYQHNCKHAAACLFALREREQNSSIDRVPERLDRKLDIWLKNLRAQEESSALKKPETTHHLTYLIQFQFNGPEHRIAIRLALAKVLKRGGYGKKVIFNNLTESKKQHFIDDDNEIVAQLLFKCSVVGWFDSLIIRNSDLLTRIIATQRAFFVSDDESPIQLGPVLDGACQWVLSVNGMQHLVLRHHDTIINPLLLDESWYFDLNEIQLGRLHTPYPPNQLRHLLEAPPIPLEQAELLSEKMAITCPEFPTPRVFNHKKVITVAPVPVLIFDAFYEGDEAFFGSYDAAEDDNAIFTIKIAFDYDGMVIPYHDNSLSLVQEKDHLLFEYKRDEVFEELKVEELQNTIALRSPHAWELYQWGVQERAFSILKDITTYSDLEVLYRDFIPQLKQQGWRTEFASPLYQEIIHADEVEWYSELDQGTTDFFSYQLGILVEGKPVSVVPLVADLIQRYTGNALDSLPDEQLVALPLNDGRSLQLPMGRIKPLVRLLLQFGLRSMEGQDQLQISKYQLILMQEAERALAATKARWQGAELLRNQLKQLTQLEQVSVLIESTVLIDYAAIQPLASGLNCCVIN